MTGFGGDVSKKQILPLRGAQDQDDNQKNRS